MQNNKAPRRSRKRKLGFGSDFLDTTPKMCSMKEMKRNFLKIRIFCSVKDKVKRMRRKATDLKEIFAENTTDRGCCPQYTKNS